MKQESLHTAIEYHNLNTVTTLLREGVDVFLIHQGRTPFERAIESNNLDILCAILFYGGYHHYIFNGQSAFLYSICCNCTIEIQKLLLNYEDNVNERFQDLSTLYWAIFYGTVIIQDILQNGGNINETHANNKWQETNVISYAFWNHLSPNNFKVKV